MAVSKRASVIAVTATLLWACSDPGRPPTSNALPDSVDQAAWGFVRHITADGIERANLKADSAFYYPSREVWELFRLTVEFRTTQGELRSTLTADQGTYNWRTQDMEARENVVAVTPDGRTLTTCAIQYDEGRDEITGPCAFVYDSENERLTGESFVADPDFRNVEARGTRGTATEIERP
jgi:LPS export ABC transporter protein LptC